MRVDKSPAINGFLNIYKDPGSTSMDVVRRVKRLTGQRKKVGHGGTLDPLAEGVLPVCFGQATRLMDFLIESDREYQMDVHLGVTTSTYDEEGEVVKRGDPAGIDLDAVKEALKAFQGVVEQVPPMYSALKHGGKPLYKLARAGIEVERQPRKVEFSRIEILDFSSPVLSMKVESGRGAYMRSLAHDLGEVLGCGAHLKNLVRLRSGPFRSDEAVTLSRIQEPEGYDDWRNYLLPVDFVLLDLKSVAVNRAAEKYIRNGQTVTLPPHVGAYAGYMEKYRAYTQDGRFFAVISYNRPRDQWQPYKVYNVDSPSPYAPTAHTSPSFRP